VIGFALLGRLDDAAHLREIDVLPTESGRGIGSALLAAACERARERGLRRMVLTTFRELPFNAPWYARCGFVELAPAELDDALERVLAAEVEAGLDGEARCAMARVL
jgi:GNAT superfamily N-acetyltransferase